MGLNYSPKLTRHLVEQNIFRDQRFSLMDVGASGGIQEHWRHFGGSLQAVGFDPLIKEVDRLNSIEPNPLVHYVASLVGCRKMAKLTPGNSFNTNPHFRTSSVRARELLECNYITTYYDKTHDGATATALVELDEYFRDHPADVDFIKVDTDGDDYAVLLGSRNLLSGAGPIGLAVETPLVGSTSSHSNVFANMDRFLQDLGYSLFSIEPRFHSRAALPKPFHWFDPFDTHAGQATWADSLFFRDVCIEGYEKQFNVVLAPHKLLKLCCAYEIFSLEDCAAEVLVQFRDRIQPVADVDRCLDLLTPPLPDGRVVSYREYIEFFEKNVPAFYSGN